MNKILNYIWRGWFLLLLIVFTPVFGIPIFFLSFSQKHYKYAYRFIHLWCVVVFYGMGMRYSLIKKTTKNIDKNRQYIFISNHTSVMDIMLISILLPNHPICFVGKKELEKIPLFGQVYRRICVTVDRNDAKSRADVYRKCAERIANGQSIVIFPEGGVPDDTSIVLDAFKNGAFSLSSEHKIPILVFAIDGLKEMFPFDNGKGHPGRVKVSFLDILEPDSLEVLKQKSYELIHNELMNKN